MNRDRNLTLRNGLRDSSTRFAKSPGMAAFLGIAGIAIVCGHLHGLDREAIWTCSGVASYDNPACWDSGVRPCNVGILLFHVTIPPSRGTCQLLDPNAACDIASLQLGAGSRLELLSNLKPSTLGMTVGGATEIPTEISGTLSVTNASFVAVDGAVLGGCGASLLAADGALIRLDATDYCSKDLRRSDGTGHQWHQYTWDLLKAAGPGTRLELSSLASIDAGFSPAGNDSNVHVIAAEDGAAIDLSGLVKVTAPVSTGDWIEFRSIGGSRIDLTSLETISAAGAGLTWFRVTGDSVSIPALKTADRVRFDLSGGARVQMGDPGATTGSLSTLGDSFFWLKEGSELTDGGTPVQYESKGLRNSDGTGHQWHRYTWDLMKATGGGTRLDLSSIASIDAGFSPAGNDSNVHVIAAEDGAAIDLSGLAQVTGPISAGDWIEFRSSGGSRMNLSSLRTLESAGDGGIVFEASGKSELTLGPLEIDATSTIRLDDASIRTAGLKTMPLFAGEASVTLASSGDRFEATGPLILSDRVTLEAAEGSVLNLGGDFSFSHTDEAKVGLRSARLCMNGKGAQFLEVGGVDVDVVVDILTNDNFSLGQLCVGDGACPECTRDDGEPSTVVLVNEIDNGNRAGGDKEALYLFGPGDEDGLRIGPGSRLVIGSLNAYARVGGMMIRLQDLFPSPDAKEVSFDRGSIARVEEDFCRPLILSRVEPSSGGNSGGVTVAIRGKCFEPGMTVRLRRASEVLAVGRDTIVHSKYEAQTTLDLSGLSPGAAVLEALNPGGPQAMIDFTVEGARAELVWVEIMGFPTFRPGLPQRFHIVFGNGGNVDAENVFFRIGGIPLQATVRPGFEVHTPESDVFSPEEWADMPQTIVFPGEQVLPIVVPRIAPGDSGVLSFDLTTPTHGPFRIGVQAIPDFLCSPGPGIAGCARAAIRALLEPVPGGAALAMCFLDAFCLGYKLRGNLRSRDYNNLGWDVLGTVASCAEKVAPQLVKEVIKTLAKVVSVAMAAVDTITACAPLLIEAHLDVRSAIPHDPNAKTGPAGVGEPRYVSPLSPLRYGVLYENAFVPDSPQENASARIVRISDTLDPQVFCLESVRLGPILAGHVQLLPGPDAWASSPDNPRALRYEAQKPTRDGVCIVRVVVSLDLDSGALEWVLDTLDPSTGEWPKDPSIGFLPPDENPPEGEGAVFFTVLPREHAELDAISNVATITFDAQPPITAYAPCIEGSADCDTPWTNAIDRVPPESKVAEASQVPGTSKVRVAWNATDEQSGVRDYTVFVCERVDGQCSAWRPWLSDTAEESGEFEGFCGKTYGFACVARDRVGNAEPMASPGQHEALVKVECGEGSRVPGDCNSDGKLAISDAICILNVLFLGRDPPAFPCGDGSPTDPSNRALLIWTDGADRSQAAGQGVNITDAIGILSYLFLGGPPHRLAVPGVDVNACVPLPGCPTACEKGGE